MNTPRGTIADSPVVPGARDLDALVARTRGPQPWRKVFHAFNASALSVTVVTLEPSQALLLGLLGGLAAILLAADIVRLRNVSANQLFFRAFASLASPREARGIASSTWYAIGVLLAFLAFPRAVAISSVLVLGLADPAASIVGQRWGKRPFLGGSLEGTAAFILVAGVILLTRHPVALALMATAVSAVAERRAWPLDDNLAVPIFCGLALSAGALLS
jgi:dolichol kinase